MLAAVAPACLGAAIAADWAARVAWSLEEVPPGSGFGAEEVATLLECPVTGGHLALGAPLDANGRWQALIHHMERIPVEDRIVETGALETLVKCLGGMTDIHTETDARLTSLTIAWAGVLIPLPLDEEATGPALEPVLSYAPSPPVVSRLRPSKTLCADHLFLPSTAWCGAHRASKGLVTLEALIEVLVSQLGWPLRRSQFPIPQHLTMIRVVASEDLVMSIQGWGGAPCQDSRAPCDRSLKTGTTDQ